MKTKRIKSTETKIESRLGSRVTGPSKWELEATDYQHHYGYQMPVELGQWGWTSTFNRWSRLVTFVDGWNGWSYPKINYTV